MIIQPLRLLNYTQNIFKLMLSSYTSALVKDTGKATLSRKKCIFKRDYPFNLENTIKIKPSAETK